MHNLQTFALCKSYAKIALYKNTNISKVYDVKLVQLAGIFNFFRKLSAFSSEFKQKRITVEDFVFYVLLFSVIPGSSFSTDYL